MITGRKETVMLSDKRPGIDAEGDSRKDTGRARRIRQRKRISRVRRTEAGPDKTDRAPDAKPAVSDKAPDEKKAASTAPNRLVSHIRDTAKKAGKELEEDAEYSGARNDMQEDAEHTGHAGRRESAVNTAKRVGAAVFAELLLLAKAIISVMSNIVVTVFAAAAILVVAVCTPLINVIQTDETLNQQTFSASAQGVVNIACSYAEQGISETGNNNVIFNTRYYGHEVSGSQYSWCVVFVYCCLEDAFGEQVDEICSKTAVVSGLKATLLEHGGTEIPIDQGQPGDIIGFSQNGQYKHCGIIVENLGHGMYKTVEGNTSAVGSESQDNGDGVYKKVRVNGRLFQIAYIIRPNYPDPVYVANDSDENLLAALIYSEGGPSYEDKLAVGTVVMNRLEQHLYGAQTLQDVIYEPSQFSGTKTETFRNALQSGAPEECLQIAHEILYEGRRSSLIPASCISFMALSISEHEMRRMTGCENFIIIDQRFGW